MDFYNLGSVVEVVWVEPSTLTREKLVGGYLLQIFVL